MFVHVDLIQGIKHDEYGAEFICQEMKPAGILSTRSSVIAKAKQKKVYAIQRMFLIDTSAMKKSIELVKKHRPDYIEVLPGVVPELIKEVKEKPAFRSLRAGLSVLKKTSSRRLQQGLPQSPPQTLIYGKNTGSKNLKCEKLLTTLSLYDTILLS